jgi:hypothetical protein
LRSTVAAVKAGAGIETTKVSAIEAWSRIEQALHSTLAL